MKLSQKNKKQNLHIDLDSVTLLVFYVTVTPKGVPMKKFDDNVPIYLQLREEIEKAIILGSVKEDEMIPSIRTLAQQYRLNPQTVSNALSELVNEGVIYKKRGIGFFVEKEAQELLQKKKIADFRTNEMEQTIRKGKQLGVTRDEFIDAVESVYTQKGE